MKMMLVRCFSSLKVKAQSHFVSSLVEVLALDERGQGQGDTWKQTNAINQQLVKLTAALTVAEFLLVGKTNLTIVVHLCTDCGVSVRSVLCCQTEFGGVAASGPVELNTSLQITIYLLEDGSSEVRTIIPEKIKKDPSINSPTSGTYKTTGQ
jgi:hypothetical protein